MIRRGYYSRPSQLSPYFFSSLLFLLPFLSSLFSLPLLSSSSPLFPPSPVYAFIMINSVWRRWSISMHHDQFTRSIIHQLMMINHANPSWSIMYPLTTNRTHRDQPIINRVSISNLWWNTSSFWSGWKISIEISNLYFINNNLLSHQNEIYASIQEFGTLVQGLNLMSLHRDSKSIV